MYRRMPQHGDGHEVALRLGPRQQVLGDAHERAADREEQDGADRMHAEHVAPRGAGPPGPEREGDDRRREQRARPPARELLRDEPGERLRHADVRLHQRALAGEQQAGEGPEAEAEQEEPAEADQIPQLRPGRRPVEGRRRHGQLVDRLRIAKEAHGFRVETPERRDRGTRASAIRQRARPVTARAPDASSPDPRRSAMRPCPASARWSGTWRRRYPRPR